MLNDQVGVTDAVSDAATGKLRDLAPFEVPPSTAQRWVREAREQGHADASAPSQPDADALDRMHSRLWALHVKSLDELERRHAEASGDEMEQRALHLLMLAAIKRQKELEKLTAHTPVGPVVTPGANGTSEDDPEAESLFARLSREAANEA